MKLILLSYKFMDRWRNDSIPNNLCPYMRMFMVTLYGVFLVALIGTFVLIAPIFAGPFVWFQYLVNDLPIPSTGIFALWWYMFHVEIGIGVGLGIVSAYIKSTDGKVDPITSTIISTISTVATNTNKALSGNIFWEWGKSVHNKICPSLEFIDDEK